MKSQSGAQGRNVKITTQTTRASVAKTFVFVKSMNVRLSKKTFLSGKKAAPKPLLLLAKTHAFGNHYRRYCEAVSTTFNHVPDDFVQTFPRFLSSRPPILHSEAALRGLTTSDFLHNTLTIQKNISLLGAIALRTGSRMKKGKSALHHA